jgi:hypothetical protein
VALTRHLAHQLGQACMYSMRGKQRSQHPFTKSCAILYTPAP